MTFNRLFFALKGRLVRKWWWLGQLAILPLYIGLSIALLPLLGVPLDYYWNEDPATPAQLKAIALVDALIFLVLLRPYLALDIKRIHDRRRSAYWLVPLYLGALILLLLEGFGASDAGSILIDKLSKSEGLTLEPALHFAFIVLFIFYSLWMFIELGILRGTRGDNKYGPDPLAKRPDPLAKRPDPLAKRDEAI